MMTLVNHRFPQPQRLMGQLNHPNIVQCHSICKQDNAVLIVMELMTQDLQTYLQKRHVEG
jgi:hypothetical protein